MSTYIEKLQSEYDGIAEDAAHNHRKFALDRVLNSTANLATATSAYLAAVGEGKTGSALAPYVWAYRDAFAATKELAYYDAAESIMDAALALAGAISIDPGRIPYPAKYASDGAGGSRQRIAGRTIEQVLYHDADLADAIATATPLPT